jgi:thiamine biosynthesis lipoprotein
MMRRTPLLALLLVPFLLIGCQQPEPEEHKTTMMVFGTLVTITLLEVDKTKADQAITAVSEDLAFMHEAWHPWRPGPMGRMNQLLGMTGEFTGNISVMPLLEKSRLLAEQSRGLFNPALGKLVALWGFHKEDLWANFPPKQDEISALLEQNPQLSDIEVDNVRISNDNPAVRLDMGAIAKGEAVQRAIDYLQSVGIEHAMVNAGGDLKAIGRHGDRPWHIGVRHPRKQCDEANQSECVIAELDVHNNEAVFTSGDYERYFEYGERRYHHILDPRTGYPADETTSVTVIHHDGATADAAATALFIAGPKLWPEIARDMGIDKVMLIDKQGVVHLSPAMAERISLSDPQTERVIQNLP